MWKKSKGEGINVKRTISGVCSRLKIILQNNKNVKNKSKGEGMNTVENEKKRTSTLYLEVVPDSGPKRAATPDLNRWQTEWKLIRLEKSAFKVINIYSSTLAFNIWGESVIMMLWAPLFEAWNESSGGIFSIWAESRDELRILPWTLIRSTAYLRAAL